MKRCRYCARIVWPWQRRGWLTGVAVWHARCYGDVPWRDAAKVEDCDGA